MNHLLRLAKQAGSKPRVHGNGFLQLDLSPTTRLHIWGHPDVPKQKVDTPIHNHRFAFTSLVLRGTMLNHLYWVDPITSNPTHRVYHAKVRTQEDTILDKTSDTVKVFPKGQQEIHAGSFYTMAEGEVHESIVRELTVTVILKSGPTLAQGGPTPTVYVPLDVTPDNSFNRYSLPVQDLWRTIHETLK